MGMDCKSALTGNENSKIALFLRHADLWLKAVMKLVAYWQKYYSIKLFKSFGRIMSIKLGVALLVACLFSSCQSNSQIIKIGDEGEYWILKGPIKKLEVNTYEPVEESKGFEKGKLYNGFEKLSGGGGKWFFDEGGTLMHQVSFKERSTDPKYYFEYEYDNKKLIKRIDYDTPEKKNRIGKLEYIYYPKGLLMSRQFFDVSYCNPNEWMLTGKAVFEYDEYDNAIKMIDSSFAHYDCEDISIRERTVDFHPKYENGRKVEDDTYEYEYDEEGNMIRKSDKGNPPIYYEYYSTGIRKKKFINVDYYYEYDEDGYDKRGVFSLRTGEEYLYEYSNRDKYGNWTRMVIYEDGKPYLIGERTITYYE